MNTYLNYYKYEVMQPNDNPPVGILLCTGKGDTLVKYATAGLDQNIFVQKYMVSLPSVDDLTTYVAEETQKKKFCVCLLRKKIINNDLVRTHNVHSKNAHPGR